MLKDPFETVDKVEITLGAKAADGEKAADGASDSSAAVVRTNLFPSSLSEQLSYPSVIKCQDREATYFYFRQNIIYR